MLNRIAATFDYTLDRNPLSAKLVGTFFVWYYHYCTKFRIIFYDDNFEILIFQISMYSSLQNCVQ